MTTLLKLYGYYIEIINHVYSKLFPVGNSYTLILFPPLPNRCDPYMAERPTYTNMAIQLRSVCWPVNCARKTARACKA